MSSQHCREILSNRAIETIRNDVTPQSSICEIFQRFPEVLSYNKVRIRIKERILRYLSENESFFGACEDQDIRAQEMFDDLLRDSKGVISLVGDILWSSNYLLFFRNEKLYSQFNHNLGELYTNLTYEQQLEFAPKVLQTHGHLLRVLLEQDRTKFLCSLAVSNSGIALKYVPDKLKSVKIMTLAVEESGYALEYVKKKYQRKLICIAYRRAGTALRRHRWFEILFQQLSEKKQQDCITHEKRDRDDAANKWWNEEYSH
tara:strand:+ start:1659 stop:2435 length:777 start_codon:yes stop_codon:yes gene_type:complete